MSDPTHHLFPLFPKGDPPSVPEEVIGGVVEPMRVGICDTADDIELDSNEEEHIESCVLFMLFIVPR